MVLTVAGSLKLATLFTVSQPPQSPSDHDFSFFLAHMQIVYYAVATVGVLVAILTALNTHREKARQAKAAEEETRLRKAQERLDAEVAQHVQRAQIEATLDILGRMQELLRQQVVNLHLQVEGLTNAASSARHIQWAVWLLFFLLTGIGFYYERHTTAQLQQAVQLAQSAQTAASKAQSQVTADAQGRANVDKKKRPQGRLHPTVPADQ